jgi:uncharacterized membrane protein
VSAQFWSRRAIRRHLIAGLIVIAPVTATAFVLWWIFQALDGLLGRFLYPVLSRYFPWFVPLPGLGLLALLLLLIIVGWAAELAIGSRIVSWWNGLIDRIPITRKIYGAANRIVRTVLGEGARPFQKVVLVEYPSTGRWAIGFLAARAPDTMQKHIEDAVSVFVPTTPNPTSGLIVIVPRQRIIELQMTVDQAFTYILSAGSVGPDVTTIEGSPVSTLPNHVADAAPVGSGRPDRVAGP